VGSLHVEVYDDYTPVRKLIAISDSSSSGVFTPHNFSFTPSWNQTEGSTYYIYPVDPNEFAQGGSSYSLRNAQFTSNYTSNCLANMCGNPGVQCDTGRFYFTVYLSNCGEAGTSGTTGTTGKRSGTTAATTTATKTAAATTSAVIPGTSGMPTTGTPKLTTGNIEATSGMESSENETSNPTTQPTNTLTTGVVGPPPSQPPPPQSSETTTGSSSLSNIEASSTQSSSRKASTISIAVLIILAGLVFVLTVVIFFCMAASSRMQGHESNRRTVQTTQITEDDIEMSNKPSTSVNGVAANKGDRDEEESSVATGSTSSSLSSESNTQSYSSEDSGSEK